MNRYSVVDIAKLIQDSIIEYQTKNPNDMSQENAEEYAIGQVLRLGRGIFDPNVICSMVNLERSVYNIGTNMRC